MNDLAPVYKAVGSILKEQRAEIDLAIANQAEKLNDLLETIRVLDSSHAKRADGLRQRLTAQAETAAAMLQKLEAKLAVLPQPYDDTDLRMGLEAKLKELRSDLLEAQTGAVSGSAGELREQIKALEAKLAALPQPATPYDDTDLRVELEAKLKELRSDLLEAQTGVITGSINQISDQIQVLEESLAALPQPAAPYDDTDLRVELEARLKELRSDLLESAALSIDKTKDQIKALEAKLAALPEPAAPYNDTDLRIELEAELKGLRNDLLKAQTTVAQDSASTVAQIQKIEAKLAALPEPTKPYDDTEVYQKLDELTESVLRLYQQPDVLKELRGGLDALRTQVDTMPGQLDERRAKAETELRHSLELLELRISKQLVELERKPGPKGKDGIGVPGRDGLGVDLKTWSPGICREGEVVQYAIGKIARAKRDTVTKPDNRTDWERIGTAGFELKGVKRVDEEYEDGDLYMDDGTMFCWYKGKGRMFARRGRDGKDGKDGKDAKVARDGKDGPQPLEIRAYADGFSLVYDNGAILDFPVNDFKQFMDEWYAEQQERADGTPISTFRGDWLQKNSYSRGDVAIVSGTAWIATKPVPVNTSFSAESWAKFAGGGGAGGVATHYIKAAFLPLTDYSEFGEVVSAVDGVVAVPMRGHHLVVTPEANISLELVDFPELPQVGVATIYFVYDTAPRAISYVGDWHWESGFVSLSHTKPDAIVLLNVWTDPLGNIHASAVDMRIPV